MSSYMVFGYSTVVITWLLSFVFMGSKARSRNKVVTYICGSNHWHRDQGKESTDHWFERRHCEIVKGGKERKSTRSALWQLWWWTTRNENYETDRESCEECKTTGEQKEFLPNQWDGGMMWILYSWLKSFRAILIGSFRVGSASRQLIGYNFRDFGWMNLSNPAWEGNGGLHKNRMARNGWS